MHDVRLDTENPIHRGPLTLFAVFRSSPPAASYITGPEAVARKLLEVREKGEGSVPELVVDNRAGDPLLLLEGEMLVGNRQTRTLNVSVLCPPKSEIVIPVSCVEHGRWGTARRSTRSPRHASSRIRAAKFYSTLASIKAGQGRRSDQGKVWDEISAFAVRHSTASPTSSLDEIQESLVRPSDDRLHSLDDLTRGIDPAPEQCGVLVGVGGRARVLDLFDRPSTFAAYWQGLLAGYAADALGEVEKPTSAVSAKRFFAKLLTAKRSTSPAVGLGTEAHLEAANLCGFALELDGTPVHVAGFAS